MAGRFEQLASEKKRAHVKKWAICGINEDVVDEAYARVHSSGADAIQELIYADRESETDRYEETFGESEGLLAVKVYFDVDGKSLAIDTFPETDQVLVTVGKDLVNDFSEAFYKVDKKDDPIRAMEIAGVYAMSYGIAARALLRAREASPAPDIYNGGLTVGYRDFCRSHQLKGNDVDNMKMYEVLFPHRFAANVAAAFLEPKTKMKLRRGFAEVFDNHDFSKTNGTQQKLWLMGMVSQLTDDERKQFVGLLTI